MRILITDQNFGDGAQVERHLVETAGGELVVEDCRSEADVAVAFARHRPDVVLVQFASIGERALKEANGVTGIVRYGVGVDNIDTRAAAARGIAVERVPDYCIAEVAEHTLGLLLAVERGLVELALETRRGGWDFHAAGRVRRIATLRLGLVGFGTIGRAVAARATPLVASVGAYDPALTAEEVRDGGAEPADFEDLLRTSDVLSLHVPLTDATRGLVGRRELALLPDGAIVLNTSRGGLLDEDALVDELTAGRLRGAGVDVLADEPPPREHALRHARGALLTPHAAWFSEAAVLELRQKAVARALALVRR
jgi:D-3-phosphoglycerate dehydrogenase